MSRDGEYLIVKAVEWDKVAGLNITFEGGTGITRTFDEWVDECDQRLLRSHGV